MNECGIIRRSTFLNSKLIKHDWRNMADVLLLNGEQINKALLENATLEYVI